MAKDRLTESADPFDRAKDAAEDVIEKARESFEATRDKIEDLGEDVSERYERLSEGLKKSAERASEKARMRYRDAAESLRSGYAKVRKDFDGLVGDATNYIRDNPGKSILIAAGVGFAIGLLFRRRGGDDT